MCLEIEDYTADLHRHRLASWASSRAANQISNFRFPVWGGTLLLMLGATGREMELNQPEKFIEHICKIRTFTSQVEFDRWHRKTVNNMMNESGKRNVIGCINKDKRRRGVKSLDRKDFSYGIAAKLLNVYLKVFYSGAFGAKKFADFIHPPVDGVLLDQLNRCYTDDFSFGPPIFPPGHLRGKGRRQFPNWTVIDDKEYREIVEMIKKFIEKKKVKGLWRIEFAWQGYQ